jgi:hypothetical protein
MLSSTNVTGMIVLCSAPLEASSKPLLQGIQSAAARVAKAGARGIIFAQHNSNLLENVMNDICGEVLAPCVLVDFEIAHRIESYARSVK